MAVLLSAFCALPLFAGQAPPLIPFQRVFKEAPHAVSARALRLTSDGKAYFKITRVFKTPEDLSPGKIILVDLTLAPIGLWPALGEEAVLALKDTKDGFALYARGGSIMPAEPPVVAALKDLFQPPPAAASTGAPPPPPLPEEQPSLQPTVAPLTETAIGPARPRTPTVIKVSDTLESQALAAEVIVIGRVVEVSFGTTPGDRAVLRFSPEEVLKGGGLPRLLRVHIPAPDPSYSGTLPPVKIGRYCLFLVSRPAGRDLDLVSPYFGLYRLKDDAEIAKFKQKLYATGAMRLLKDNPGPIITTIQALVSLWEDAWNAKDLTRLMTCYSRAHPFYRMYHAGGQHRLALERRLQEFPAKVRLDIKDVQFPEKGRADITLGLTLEVDGAKERREAVMKAVKEEGEWRILSEGF